MSRSPVRVAEVFRDGARIRRVAFLEPWGLSTGLLGLRKGDIVLVGPWPPHPDMPPAAVELTGE
jgi:hypothetical protein